ncbi:acyl-CoA dehydrogenase family protein [Kitasatospora sp. NPDC087314]|uniref:acyl-CoA dehydrogenase family protein n=1 Tax=Kitasatospora sp. NPDC087314 TaxID=3364068 RepID=UPI00380EA120
MIGTVDVTLAADPAADPAELGLRARISELEEGLGDPLDPTNPLGHAAVLAADERGEPLDVGERLLDRLTLNHEFVPRALGGRLDRMDALVRLGRALFRRDATLGLGYGVVSFLAAVPIWIAGDEPQRRRMARLLLDGGRPALAYLELAHGNDFFRNGVTAVADGAGHRLTGRKEMVNNAERADGVVVFGRTATGPEGHGHSVFFFGREHLVPEHVWTLPRRPTVGARGCQFGGFEFDDCPAPAGTLVGQVGDGMRIALRSFQLTRSVIPGMVLGGADTALRIVVRFAAQRRLQGRSPLEMPHSRAALVGAFADLLACDSLALVATRAAHLLPEQTSVLAAAVKYLLPKLLGDAVYDLSGILGADFHARRGEYGLFEKQLRDLPVTTLGHAGTAACLATIVPQLPRFAGRSWLRPDGLAPPELFEIGGPLPDLDPARLALTSPADALCASLVEAADFARWWQPVEGPDASLRELRRLSQTMVDELGRLRHQCRDLPIGAPADAAGLALADRYTLLLAAAACLGVWRHQLAEGRRDFLADPVWPVAALRRIARRLGRPVEDPQDAEQHPMLQELLDRYHDGRTYDLYDSHLG